MSRKAIQIDILALVVADMDRCFATKDVSEDVRMLKAHPELVPNIQYHGFVGGALSDHRAELGIAEIKKHTSRGSRWEKQGGVKRRIPKTPGGLLKKTNAEETASTTIGPQYKGDDPFTARMRLHQSWYRSHVLRLDCGTGPSPSSKSLLGNMLTRDDGAAGCNFLTPEITQVARDRVAIGVGTVEPYRLFHNMLSSQPMCFNLFGPLVKDRALARRLLAQIIPDEIAEVTIVALEYAPEPTDDYLGDRTAFDAFIEYKTPDGRLCGLGIETKLTEPFSQKEYDGKSYRRWMRVQGGPWKPDADAKVHVISHNQLWRDHLLAIAMRYHSRSKYSKVRLMVVHHPADPECAGIVEGYCQLLHDGDDTVLGMPLDHLHARWAAAVESGRYSNWLHEFGVRYLELDRSSTMSCPH